MSVGQSLWRVESRLKVSGGIEYTVDIRLPNMLEAKVLRSPYPHARIVRIDTARAERLPGVTVLTAADLADFDHAFGVTHRDQPIVATDRVRFIGDVVAAVAAERADLAEAALELIDIEYEPLETIVDPGQAVCDDAALIHDDPRPRGVTRAGWPAEKFRWNQNVCYAFHIEQGDIERGFAEADHIFEGTYRVPGIHHGNMEPHAAIAAWDQRGFITVHTSTQSPSIVQAQLAELFGLPMSSVRVIVPHVGGAFGAKVYAKIEPLAVALSRKAGRPVRLVLSREEVFATATRHAASVYIKTGAKADGTIVAREVTALYDTGAYADCGPREVKKGGYNAGGPYRIEHESLTSYCVYTNKPPAVAFRGFGVPQVCWAYESQMDEIARHLGLDPLTMRLRNVVREKDVFVTGEVLTAVSLDKELEAAANAIGWDTPLRTPSDPAIRVGRGIACSIKSTSTPSNSAATVRLNADGSVHVLTSSVEIGQGSTTALAQIVAETMGVRADKVAVSLPDTAVTPFDQSTISSRTVFSMGRALHDAGLDIRRQILQVASDVLEAHPRDLEIEDGEVYVRGDRDAAISIPDLFIKHFGSAAGNFFGHSVFQTRGGLDPTTSKGKASATWFFAAAAAEVEVDTETGKVRITKLATAADAGKAINPVQCHLQNEGAMLTALGSALFEELIYDSGEPANASFVEYGMPSFRDHPAQFHSIVLETPSEEGPYGARGIGESVISPVAPAVGNAVAAALNGARVRDLPILPERVLAAIADAGGAQP